MPGRTYYPRTERGFIFGGYLMTITYQVYRLLEDGDEQSLGFFVNDRDAMIKAFDYYSEVRYPHSYVDYREV